MLGDLAPAQGAEEAVASVRDHLYLPYGALLLAPAYTTPLPEILPLPEGQAQFTVKFVIA